MPLPRISALDVGGRRALAGERPRPRGCAPRRGGSSRAARRSTAPRRCRPRAPACSAPASASASTAVDGCVPLISASPSFGPSVTGCRPARAAPRRRDASRGSRPGDSALALRRLPSASPSPISTSARCASGARSPLAPTDPRDGTSGCTPRVEQRDQRVERLEPDAGEALRQHVRAQRHRRAHGADRQRLADAGRVAAQQVELQRFERVGRDLDVGERAEAGVDAVGRLVAAARADRRRRATRATRARAPSAERDRLAARRRSRAAVSSVSECRRGRSCRSPVESRCSVVRLGRIDVQRRVAMLECRLS